MFYGRENSALTLEKESKLRKFESKVLIIIFDWTGTSVMMGKVKSNSIICIFLQILLASSH
jgi:hypothetical protein